MKAETNFDIVIKPSNSWFDFKFYEVFKYRDLLLLFVRRDFIVTHAQSLLGPLWYFLTPLISTLVFVVVFGKIAQVPTDGLPHTLFYLSGLTLWNYFGGCTGKIQDVLYLNSGTFSRIYFPRIIVPLSYLVSSLIPFVTQLLTLLLATAFYNFILGVRVPISANIVFLPILMFFTALLAMGIGLLVSSISFRYRDFIHVSGFFLSMLMYASPIVYPASRIPESYHFVFFLNPLAALIETYRFCIYGVGSAPLDQLLQSAIITLIIFFLGFIVFNRAEKTFVDTV